LYNPYRRIDYRFSQISDVRKKMFIPGSTNIDYICASLSDEIDRSVLPVIPSIFTLMFYLFTNHD